MKFHPALIPAGLCLLAGWLTSVSAASLVMPAKSVEVYADGRPAAHYRLEAKDQGIVLRHGDGPGNCDIRGAREAIVFEDQGTFYLHYDGAGGKGWLACLATSKDLIHWEKQGVALDFGQPGAMDSAAACSPWVIQDGNRWHMFYFATPNATPAPDNIPGFPYLTMKAESATPTGPWQKRYDVTPFQVKTNSYYSGCASPGYIIKQGDEYLMFFSASTANPILRTLSIARTRNLDGAWTPDLSPLVPLTEQVENSSLYFEKKNKTWFLFTNHVGIKDGMEYTDAIWVYWSKDLTKWDSADKTVVLDARNCKWSKHIIGLPSVVRVGKRLAVFYDGQDASPIPPGVQSHMNRDIGLAWLDLPLVTPTR